MRVRAKETQHQPETKGESQRISYLNPTKTVQTHKKSNPMSRVQKVQTHISHQKQHKSRSTGTRYSSKPPQNREESTRRPRSWRSGSLAIAHVPQTDHPNPLHNKGSPNVLKTDRRRQNILKNVEEALGKQATWSEILQHQLQHIEVAALLDPHTLLSHTRTAFRAVKPRMTVLEEVEWQRALKEAAATVRRRGPRKAAVGAPQEILQAMEAQDELVRLAGTLHVLMATRLQTVLMIHVDDVYRSPFPPANVVILIRESKTATAIDAYATHLVLRQEELDLLSRLAAERKHRQYLFPPELWPRITDRLSTVLANLGLTVPSVRQSTLQAVAMSVGEEAALSLSRHKSRQGLRAYLRHGAFSVEEALQQTTATAAIRTAGAPTLERLIE